MAGPRERTRCVLAALAAVARCQVLELVQGVGTGSCLGRAGGRVWRDSAMACCMRDQRRGLRYALLPSLPCLPCRAGAGPKWWGG